MSIGPAIEWRAGAGPYAPFVAGDVDGDGFSDVVLTLLEGYPFSVLVPGGPEGPIGGSLAEFNPDVGVPLPVGDVNDDGFDDLVSFGPPAGAWIVYGGLPPREPARLPVDLSGLESPSGTVLGLGDVNGDGFDDFGIAVIAPDSPLVVFHGSADGPVQVGAIAGVPTYPGAAGGFWPAGDLEGDGYDDLLAFHGDDNGMLNGAVVEYRGGPSGLSTEPWVEVTGTSPGFGVYAARAGDLNGDGREDVVIVDFSVGAMLYPGTSTGLAPDWWRMWPSAPDAMFGVGVGNVGDYDGDGYDDVYLGAARPDGTVYDDGTPGLFITGLLYGGGPDGPRTNDPLADVGILYQGPAPALVVGPMRGDLWGDHRGSIVLAVGDRGFVFHGFREGAPGDDTGQGPPPDGVYPYGYGDDVDHDGYFSSEDCDDRDGSLHPGAVDVWNDGIDQDCDGADARYAYACGTVRPIGAWWVLVAGALARRRARTVAREVRV